MIIEDRRKNHYDLEYNWYDSEIHNLCQHLPVLIVCGEVREINGGCLYIFKNNTTNVRKLKLSVTLEEWLTSHDVGNRRTYIEANVIEMENTNADHVCRCQILQSTIPF